MEPEGISLPVVDDHRLMPWNDLRRGRCCGRFKSVTDGFYCKICDFFVHKECSELSEPIEHPFHPTHPLMPVFWPLDRRCDACGKYIVTNLLYRCKICDFVVDLCCAKYPPPEVVDVSTTHNHKLTLHREKKIMFQCCASTCTKKRGYWFSYKCHECDLYFHVACAWSPPGESHRYEPESEVNHSYHSLHSLKLLTTASSLPGYSDGKCRLCGRKVDEFCYHCSSCNFTLDMCCVLNPPPHSLMDLKTHDHQLTLLPRLVSFVCNACGLSGDRSPYVCLQCDFMIHMDCVGLPRIININRHDHRVSRVSLLGLVNSVCGVCRQKVDWTCGGYSCQKCPGYVVHSKCATRKDVWNGEELDGVPEETEDIEPYVVIDENTIRHFSHEEHLLRFQVGGFRYEENKRCKACIQPISLQSFYECMDCDFLLHKNCAELPKRRRHVLHNERLTLVTSEADYYVCHACHKVNNGFKYEHWNKEFDVICGSISEPFYHPSHPHPLYYIPTKNHGVCNGCKGESQYLPVLRCVEKDCEFILDFECATLPQVVKHRIDDHPLLLCYGEKASGKCWCYICEKEINPEKWFYTCKDHWATLHTKCVLGDFTGLMPGSIIEFSDKCEVVLNKSATRPCCSRCKLRCVYPIFLKFQFHGTSDIYICSDTCLLYLPVVRATYKL